MESQIVNTIGLFLVIVGCLLLYKFGLSAPVDPSGHVHIIAEQVDDAEIVKGKLYRARGRFGIVLVLIGSVFQICATWTR